MEIVPNWHPLLVHFTIALYAGSSVLFIFGYFLFKNDWKEKFYTTAYINLWGGALMTVFTVAAGIYAYNTVQHDAPSHLAMTDHKNWALVTAVFFWSVALWSIYNYRKGKVISLYFVIVMLIGVGMLGVTGFKGGEIVYRHGLGVMSLPQNGGEGHEHNHGEVTERDHGTKKIPDNHDDGEAEPHAHDEGETAPHAHEDKKSEKQKHSETEHEHISSL